MVQATQFLLRWLYLNNLIHDRVEIQSLPHIHPHDWQSPPASSSTPLLVSEERSHDSLSSLEARTVPTSQGSFSSNSSNNSNNSSSSSTARKHSMDTEREWRQRALHAIALYPPGALRLLALDSLRLEVVHELARELHQADEIVQEFVTRGRREEQRLSSLSDHNNEHHGDVTDDTLIQDLKRDMNVQWEQDTSTIRRHDHSIPNNIPTSSVKHDMDDEQAIIDLDDCEDSSETDHPDNVETSQSTLQQHHPQPPHGTTFMTQEPYRPMDPKNSSSSSSLSTDSPASLEPKVRAALALQRETREYMPQLVSAILHSPAPLTQSTMYTPHLNPLEALQHLLITRCVRDPNLGIEVCWLLEAEVGRAWKRLFEHRAQTGRRLIVILDADKAAVLSQIGSEKKQAFDLLQEVECATAYGAYGQDYHDVFEHLEENARSDGGNTSRKSSSFQDDKIGYYSTPRLPAALSQKRCSHFGDTMTFLDKLTQISLDLRMVPVHQRNQFLVNSLEEMNRRLRRRMITKGMVSLDVEDNRGPYDWPSLEDLPLECIHYSIHLPLEPTATVWPKGVKDTTSHAHLHASPLLELKTEHGVMRVLNIVSNKGRVLASRERCPYLVHCEVVETGLEGRDARLYAFSNKGFGCTIQEALGVAARKKQLQAQEYRDNSFTKYMIPPELSESTMSRFLQEKPQLSKLQVRGGNQGGYYYPSHMDDYNPYEMVREEQLQQLHEHLQSHQHHPHYAPQHSHQMHSYPPHHSSLSTSSDLLDRVYGSRWAETCEKIRQSSPYGKVKGWRLASFIMKAGEDIRREALVMQVISKMKIWFESDIPLENRPFLKPYTIMCVGGDAGLLECLRDAKSVDEVKKSTDGFTTLRDYFERAYGQPTPFTPMQAPTGPHLHVTPPITQGGEISFEKAQDNFLRSLVGYSLICYILQIKDRHNANILLDREGHIMHIDFGFVLGDTPKMGKVPLFNERAPFKLTSEFWEVIGGWNFNEGGLGVKFCKMFEEAFACASSHADELVTLIEAALMNLTRNSHEAKTLSNEVRYRLRMRGPRGSVQQKMFIMDLVNTALTSWGTSTYDWLQKSMNGYI